VTCIIDGCVGNLVLVRSTDAIYKKTKRSETTNIQFLVVIFQYYSEIFYTVRQTMHNIVRKGRIIGICIFLSVFIILFPRLAGAVKISAFVDQNRIMPDESVRLTVTIEGGNGEIDTSVIKDFTVVSRGTGSSVQIINGHTTRKTNHNFILIPLSSGTLTIPPLRVKTGGQTLKTREITIKVSPSSADDTAPRDLFVRAVVSDNVPYVGEQIIYTFKLFSAIRIANLRFQKPEFSGFTARQIGDSRTVQTVVNGRNFDVTELDYLLVPVTEGNKTIDSAMLGCDVIQRNKNRNFGFNNFFDDQFFGNVNSKPAVLRTDPLTVNVKPLPENLSSDEFCGLVGQFRMKIEINERALKTGDSTTLTVTISGSGNIMDAQDPDIAVPDGFKVYQDTPEEDIHLGPTGYSGSKTFRSALVAVTPGSYRLSPVRMVFFDPQKKQYCLMQAGPFDLTVISSGKIIDVKVPPESAPGPVAKIKKRAVEFTGHDILPLKENLDALQSRKNLSLIRFMLYLLMPVCIYLTVRLVFVFIRKDATPRTRMLGKADKALKKAARTSVSREEFLDFLYRALVAAIFAVAGRIGASITYQETRDLMQSSGYSDEVVEQTVALLKKIESAKYGGVSLDVDLKNDLLIETRQLIKGGLL